MAIEVKEFFTPDGSSNYGMPEGYCLRCTTTGLVFGPTLDAERGPCDAEAFLTFVHERHTDPRALAPRDLADLYALYCRENEPVVT